MSENVTESTSDSTWEVPDTVTDLTEGPWSEDAPQEEGHSLLRIWSEVLSNVERARDEGVNMSVAGRIVSSWPQISFQETAIYHNMYHEILLELRELLIKTIRDNPGAIDHMEKADMELNHKLYEQLVIDWNILLDEYELEWNAQDEDSHIWYAAIVDARVFLFNREGFAGHLESRGFTLDSDEIFEAIRAAREERRVDE